VSSKSGTLNEEETINLIWRVLSHSKRSAQARRRYDPFSDDVAWFDAKRYSHFVVAKTDMLVVKTDAPPQMTAFQIAFKAVTAAVSDFAAKGVRPSFCIVSIAIPKSLSISSYLIPLAKGFDFAARKYGLKIIAGDTNSTTDGLVIDVPLIGFASRIVKRDGARAGNLVGVSGLFGLQSSGLSLLLRKTRSKSPIFARKAKRSILQPQAKLKLGLSVSNYLTSSIDSSDGLALSLYYLAESSRVNISLDKVPIASGVARFASENNLEPKDLVFFGGEEYELVMTFDPKHEQILKRHGIVTIGKVLESDEKEEPSVFLRSQKIERRGWLHNQ
jgi:thiamine-monophosphate kinase